MAIGTLSEQIFLRSLPEDCVFTVTSLDNAATKDWSAYFSAKAPPYQVAAGAGSNGLIAQSSLSSTSVTDSGPGPSNTIHFTVACTINNTQVSKTGYITFSSTDWPVMGRPDYSLLLFQFDQSEARQISQKTPTLLTPDPYYISFALQDNKLLMVASTEDNLSTEIMSNILNGIITAHTKALSWAIGLVF